MNGFPIRSGQGVAGDVGIAPPFTRPDNPTATAAAIPETIAPAPPVPLEPEKAVDWISTPSLAHQRSLYSDTVRKDKILAEIFDLSNAEQLKAYNTLLQRTDTACGDVQIMQNLPEFSEKTDNWKVFVSYQTFLFKRLTPKQTAQ